MHDSKLQDHKFLYIDDYNVYLNKKNIRYVISYKLRNTVFVDEE